MNTKKVALVTGGSRGIGYSIVKKLSKIGYHVATNYHSNPCSEKEFNELSVKCYKCDISNYKNCQSLVENIESDIGKIDVLVNNAGIIKDSMMHKMDVEDWHKVINTNLNGSFYMIRSVIEGMRERKYGRIVSISSVNALAGCIGQTNYSASKAAIIAMSKSLALECAKFNITVNVVAPGYIKTDMTKNIPEKVIEKIISQIPAQRMGSTDEIACAVEYLISDQASFITGETLSINGGSYMQ